MAEVDLTNTTVRVAVRVRPFSEKELREGGTECVEVGKDGTVSLQQDEDKDPSQFAFDHVFGKDSTQPFVFEMLGMPLLDKSFEGYNSTIFAYGQTGSGKTHTMMSDRKSDDRGLIPRISENLFERIAKLTSDSRKFLVCCSFLEIYNEIVYDLLVPRGKNTPKTGLEIREGKGIGVYVKDLQEIVVDSSEKLQKLIDQGFEHRATAATQMNASSSRSHCLFIIKMHQKDDQNASNNNFSKMNLVDLAGSERASRTGAQGDTLKEGANINKSLSALGNVINALSSMGSGSKKVFIPYRNSKLTRVLQESLGGNALTTMMAALSPSKTNAEESLSTLNYAKRAKSIKVNATKNEESEQIAKLEEEVEALKAKLAEQASGVADTSRYEVQIAEMERFMKQTWEDKELESQRHEEERKKLEEEAQKIIERAKEERNRRLKLLEDKGDLELTIQELKSLDAGEELKAEFIAWPSQIGRLLALEQRTTAQCRAATLLKDAVVHDVEHWCDRRSVQEAGGREEDDGAGARMLMQQAERKVSSMLRELETLRRQEEELVAEAAQLLPQVRQLVARVSLLEESEEKEKEKEKEGEEGAKEVNSQASEEFMQVLNLVLRQLDAHRAKVWGQIAEDHKALGSFVDGLPLLLQGISGLGADVSELEKQTKLQMEIGGSSSSKSRLPKYGAEAIAAMAVPMGVASQEIPDSQISASSNAEAATSVRLLGGVESRGCPFGGWTPATDSSGEYVQVDLGRPVRVCGFALEGRRPASGNWTATRPLLAQVLDPSDPLPPEKIFKRPPVRLIHDTVIAVHSRYKALSAGKPDFTEAQLDYKQLQNGDRQTKVDFFERVMAKTAHALKEAGLAEKVPPLKLGATEILGGKNTAESNRLLQILLYLGLRKKLKSSETSGGLLDVVDQWVTKFTVQWSNDGKDWTPLAETSGEAIVFDGPADAEKMRYLSLGSAQPANAVRFLRFFPQEWQGHPGLRLEVFGWDSVDLPPSLKDPSCRLDVVCQRGELLKKCLALASAAAHERWQEDKKAEQAKHQQAMAERSQVEQQLQDTALELEELRKAYALLQEKADESEQKLIDADTEKLRLEVDRDRAENQVQALEEKLNAAMDGTADEKSKVRELEAKCEDFKAAGEDLQQQIGVLTEERDVARTREEELFDSLAMKDEELMNTNEGYVYLTDQLNEVREELEEKIDNQERLIDSLNERNKELLDESLKLRQELGESRRQTADAEKALQRAEQGLPSLRRASLPAPATATTISSTPRAAGEGEIIGYPGGFTPRDKQETTQAAKADDDYEDDFDDDD
eukprot:CAMPEP_0197626046 /NCGR_PEP_ID=MMETSP1338-20131121/5196_1 /TAXON_ID=43686 ORGANISM="Pelagodinium beii, Strain RCC1491" /NCGR_SAMPLE_ID=MMETSP1338 /ASSEMBLY_ACC=CAM_ASM_000754 /LENGTH=1304 /DNA_ID=CAMNT_0043196563 /DNA_START=42 /DNA_END=3956 /DNA_ORIENTATION=-